MARLEDEGIGVEDEFGCGLLDNLIEISGQIEYQNGESISFLFLKKKNETPIPIVRVFFFAVAFLITITFI